MSWFRSNPERLALETRLVRQAFPRATFVKKDDAIRIRIRMSGVSGSYECELVYPRRFPWEEIRAYVRSPALRPSPHQFTDGRLCLHHAEDVGPETTGVVYLNWLEGWIKHYEEYQRTETWD